MSNVGDHLRTALFLDAPNDLAGYLFVGSEHAIWR